MEVSAIEIVESEATIDVPNVAELVEDAELFIIEFS